MTFIFFTRFPGHLVCRAVCAFLILIHLSALSIPLKFEETRPAASGILKAESKIAAGKKVQQKTLPTPAANGNPHTTPLIAARREPVKLRQHSSLNSRGLDNDSINLLARLIHAEARGEPLLGQVAVGAVVLNRLKSGQFSKNLYDIIYKRGEFCTVRDGQINLRPGSQAYRAAQLALEGWDPSGGALYFYNPARTTSRWIWTRKVTARIGNHVFAR